MTADLTANVGRLDAYYYSFDATGVPIIDAILSAVAQAGKSYHSTEFWADDELDGSPSSCEWHIQQAANEAALRILAALEARA